MREEILGNGAVVGRADLRGVGVADLSAGIHMRGLKWVDDAGALTGEGAVELSCRGKNGRGGGGGLGAANGLLIADEEESVVEMEDVWDGDGTAEGSAELIALERVDGFDSVDVAEVVRCVEGAVADVLEEVAVVLRRSAARDDVN